VPFLAVVVVDVAAPAVLAAVVDGALAGLGARADSVGAHAEAGVGHGHGVGEQGERVGHDVGEPGDDVGGMPVDDDRAAVGRAVLRVRCHGRRHAVGAVVLTGVEVVVGAEVDRRVGEQTGGGAVG